MLSSGLIHDADGPKQNCTRMGFGWMNSDEMADAVNVLKTEIQKMRV